MQSVPLQLEAIEGKIEVVALVGGEGEKSGWRRSEEGFHSSLPSFFWVCFGGGEAGGKQSISDLSSPISPSPLLASHDHRFPICWMAKEKNQRWRGNRPLKEAFLVFSVWQNRTQCWLAGRIMPKIHLTNLRLIYVTSK